MLISLPQSSIPVRWRVLLTSVLLLPLAACGGSNDQSTQPQSSTPPPTAASSSTPPSTPASPTPSAEPTRSVTKYGQLTLVFNQPAKVDAKAQPALKAYRLFQQTFRRMLGTDRDDPVLNGVAGPTVVKYVQGVLQNQRKDGDKLGGTLIVTATIKQAGQSAVLIGGCFDQSTTYGIRPNGSHYQSDVTKTQPKLQIAALATPFTGGWRITDYKLESSAC